MINGWELFKIFLPYFVIVGGLGLFLLIFYKKIIGMAGEFWVKSELKKLPKNYLVINDLMIINQDTSHQIDHVVISEFGIFVIETKQYNGYIVGKEYDKTWTINKKYHVYNPIHQNYGHVKALEELLKIDNSKFIPIVCIPSTAKVKVKSKSHVLRLYELNSTILSYTTPIIQNKEEIYNYLDNSNIKDKKLRKNHIKYAKSKKAERNYADENVCPKCGGCLVLREGKYGKFYGCSNYPK